MISSFFVFKGWHEITETWCLDHDLWRWRNQV
jgi:hypothetical protein